MMQDIPPIKIPPRPQDSHKGMFGHVVLIGGNLGMTGAPRLAAAASLRSGAGRVTLITTPQSAVTANSLLPELLCLGVGRFTPMPAFTHTATVFAIGPGLGQDAWAKRMMNYALKQIQPLVIDADGLRWLANSPKHNTNWILTPHPGEAAALLNVSIQQIQENRSQAALKLQQKYGGIVVLKGAHSIVVGPDQPLWTCTAGNPGMATAGMGDSLTGIIAGLVAQHLSLYEAAVLGVWVHAKAGDYAAMQGGQRGLMPSDLLPYIRQLVNIDYHV